MTGLTTPNPLFRKGDLVTRSCHKDFGNYTLINEPLEQFLSLIKSPGPHPGLYDVKIVKGPLQATTTRLVMCYLRF